MSLATINEPDSNNLVFIGCLVKTERMSSILLLRLIFIVFSESSFLFISGKYFAGFFSSFSINTPLLFILANTCLSAEHETPMPIGHEAPCLDSLITLTS